MVTVAKNIDAPIKLLAPRSSSPSGIDFAMLGLGDVVVPGLMVALCLRFDFALHAKRHPTEDVTPRSGFKRWYFWCAVVSYVVGLGVTMGVMHWSGRAQPALLYLSPACGESSEQQLHTPPSCSGPRLPSLRVPPPWRRLDPPDCWTC
jgi:minor histocompatibility antigen H13